MNIDSIFKYSKHREWGKKRSENEFGNVQKNY